MRNLFVLITVGLCILIVLTQCLTFGGATRTIRLESPTPVDAFQVMILLGRHNFTYNGAKPDGSDIRVFDTGGNLLPHWIENWNPYGISSLWVRVPVAGTDCIIIKSGNPGDTPGSDGRRVFDPLPWDMFKKGWFYSGIMPGMVSGWEDPLTEFDMDTTSWTPVDIETDYVGECEHARWFVRKEIFIAGGEVTFSGQADDDVVWSLIGSDELYTKIGGNELDSNGRDPGEYSGTIRVSRPFGRFILAGRGQQGAEEAFLTITGLDAGAGVLYTRKGLEVTVSETGTMTREDTTNTEREEMSGEEDEEKLPEDMPDDTAPGGEEELPEDTPGG
jgi:hypothetical protein